ncbi:MAG: nucleoside-triphosphatase [Elusimicrobiales bacterium]|nr:nucleoside-triphosphatase [Elusimicrobiales bacterium]
MLILITGQRNSGKTACAAFVAKGLAQSGAAPGGVITRAEFSEGKKRFYFVQSVKTGKEKYLLEVSEEGPQVDNKGFIFARRAICSSADCGCILIDEFGAIEAGGGGFMIAVARIAAHFKGNFVVTARPSLAAAAKKAFGPRAVKILDLAKTRPEKAARKILDWLSK